MCRLVSSAVVTLFVLICVFFTQPGACGPPLRITDDLEQLLACNNETEFDCEYAEDGVRKCIPLDWLCDNVVDCPRNLKDEAMCRYVHFCRPDMLICRNGACVDADYKCNGIDDCGDGTDERSCPIRSELANSQLKCPDGFFRCANGPCITNRAKCDYVKDCPEGEDEKDCTFSGNHTTKCDEHQFLCDMACVPRSWKCDGKKDCSDGSDEVAEECAWDLEEDELGSLPSRDDYHSHVVNQSFCSSTEFLCEPGVCIGKERLCDLKEDCPKGNDEGGWCGACVSFGCSHRCTDTPEGAVCSCREGEQLSVDGRVCEDIDECASVEGRICSHRCINVRRSFECACFEHYQLASDGRSCHADGDSYSSVLFSLGSEVRHMPPYSAGSNIGYGTTQKNDEVGTTVRSISFSPRQNMLLLAVTNADHQGFIHSSTNGVQYCLLQNVVGISNVAVDWITTNVYYSAQYPSKVPGIGVCSSDGRYCKLLVEGVADNEYFKRQTYHGLVVDPRNAMMYWIDVPGTLRSPKIMAASMDGTRVRSLVTSKLSHPQGLAMDYLRQHLYFADIDLQLIERVDVVSRERAMVTSRGVHHPHELAFFDDYLYWSDFHTEAIVAVRVGSEDFPHVVHSLDQMPYGITVNHSVLWDPDMFNPCEGSRCRLCVLATERSQVVHRCVCPNLYSEEEDGHCRPLNASEIAELGSKQEVPAMCFESMTAHCRDGNACFNGGICQEVSGFGGSGDGIICDCRLGYSGQYCEEGKEWAEETMLAVESAWLLTLLIFTVLFSVAIIVYLASARCPFVQRMADRIMSKSLFWHFGDDEEDREEIVKETTLVYERDGFNNPSYGASSTDAHVEHNTLPQGSSVPERHGASPRFTLGSSA